MVLDIGNGFIFSSDRRMKFEAIGLLVQQQFLNYTIHNMIYIYCCMASFKLFCSIFLKESD
jgi:hypothetical protein